MAYAEKKEYLAFFKEYFDYMDDLNPEQFYQLMGLIRNARFNGIYTEASEIEDKEVRLAWRCIRPSIIKSRQNAKQYSKKNGAIAPNEEFDVETGEVITPSIETQNKAQIEPYKEKGEEVITDCVKVAETAPKVAKNEDSEIMEEDLAEIIVNERLEDLQNYEIGEYESNIRNIMNDYCEGETYMFKNNLFKEIRNKLKECV